LRPPPRSTLFPYTTLFRSIASSLTNGISKIDKTYVLPNFNLKYNLTDNSILRAAGSMSYTMPQFKEVAPFKYQDVSFSSQGNPEDRKSTRLNSSHVKISYA